MQLQVRFTLGVGRHTRTLYSPIYVTLYTSQSSEEDLCEREEIA